MIPKSGFRFSDKIMLQQRASAMQAQPLDPIVKAALAAFALLFFLGGVGWAYWGTDIFLTAIMAGLAYCGLV